MSQLKPKKPDNFSGKRDQFAVQSWLYQVKQYITLVQVGPNDAVIDEPTQISFASSFFTSTAANWWYTIVAANQIPVTWANFENMVKNEFIPFDSVQRTRDKMRKLVQRTSVSAYLSEFRNMALMIADMSEGEKLDRFCQGLKPEIRLEVLKAGTNTIDQASRIALSVDSALFGAGMISSSKQGQSYSVSGGSGATPMEIGNLENLRGKNACFKCQTVGCRPWLCSKESRKVKHSRESSKKSVSYSNVDAEDCCCSKSSASEEEN